MTKKKDAYSRFSAKLSEEEFRRYWGDRDEGMIAARNSYWKLAEMTDDEIEKREFLKTADKLDAQLEILNSVFLSIEKFRVVDP